MLPAAVFYFDMPIFRDRDATLVMLMSFIFSFLLAFVPCHCFMKLSSFLYPMGRDHTIVLVGRLSFHSILRYFTKSTVCSCHTSQILLAYIDFEWPVVSSQMLGNRKAVPGLRVRRTGVDNS